MEPKYSIIIPTFNEEKFLPHLLESLVQQTYTNFEVIVSDGPSRDKTVEIARSFQKKLPLLTIVTSKRASLPHQRNNGAAAARGSWYLFIDADSVLLPHFLERVDGFVEAQHPSLFTTWCRPDSEVGGDALVILFTNIVIEGSVLLRRPVAPGPLAAVKRALYELVGGYDETLEWGEDYDFTNRIYKRGIPLTILRETLYVYSLRRFRRQGTLRTIQTYARAILSVLLTKKTPKNVPGYIMGGHLYDQKKKSVKRSVLRQYEVKLRKLTRELFA